MKKVVIGIPLEVPQVNPEFVTSLLNSVKFSLDSDIEFFVDFQPTNSIKDMGLNVLANRVLKSKTVDGILFLEPYLTWSNKSLISLINHNEDVLSGAFPQDDTAQEMYDIKLTDEQNFNDKYLKADYVNMGACYVSKNALEKASEYVPHSKEKDFFYFFSSSTENNIYSPGFFNFCGALKKANISINIEKSANFGRMGQIKFDGNYEKFIQNKWVSEQAALLDLEEQGFTN